MKKSLKKSTNDIIRGMIDRLFFYSSSEHPKSLNVSRVRVKFKEMIKQWHDEVKPKYIFLNETSATPFGFLFKAAWREAYPNEQIPRFYRIDPSSLSRGSPSLKDVPSYLSKRITDKSANIIIFDETGPSGASTDRVINWLSLPREKVYVYRGLMTLPPGVTNSEFRTSEYDLGQSGLPIHPSKKVTEKNTGIHHWDRDRPSEYRLTSRIVKGSRNRKEALKYISELKYVGIKIGKEIRKEGQNGKNLEGKVLPVITIGALVLSIFFGSNSLTGNAVVDLSVKTSSFLVAGLFAISLIAGSFWLKSKKVTRQKS